MTNRPRLLFISPRFLFPRNEGGKIRTGNILQQLKGHEFEIILASPAPADRTPFLRDIDAVCDRFVHWPMAEASIWRRALLVLDRLPVSVALDRSRIGVSRIAEILSEYPDVVLVDFPHAAVLVPDPLRATSVMFTHNVEAEIFERHAEIATGAMRRVWRDQSRKMESFEATTLRRFDKVIAVSGRDANVLRRRYGPLDVAQIETGVDLDFFGFRPWTHAPVTENDDGTVVFTGAMDSPANIDGIEFFLDQVWPVVLRTRPRAKFVVVGRNPPKALVSRSREPGINCEFTGMVDDIRPFVGSANVAVIPLRVGSGTRIKAFEAMAMGRPVVSTSLGVEGLDIDAGRHYLRADSPDEFAIAVLKLLGDHELRETVAAVARRRVEERFSWARIARQFAEICLNALSEKKSRGELKDLPIRASA